MQYNWRIYKNLSDGIEVDVPDSETLSFVFENGKINSFVKYCGSDNIVLEQIFDVLWSIKPFFVRLEVRDDFGLWYKYISQFNKDKFPPFRELKEIEKAELERWFDLPIGQNSIFSMTETEAILMFMICKDMNDQLINPLVKEDLLTNIDSRIRLLPMYEDDYDHQFIGIVTNWILKKLRDKSGKPIGYNTKNWDNSDVFAWLMAEKIFGFWGGNLGSMHSKLCRYVNHLEAQGYDLDDKIIFLRFIYSTLEYLKFYRSNELINRN